MKFLITESKIKEFIQNKFNIDLTDNIYVIASYEDLPWKHRYKFNEKGFNNKLNEFGPMYYLSYKDLDFIISFQTDSEGKEASIVELSHTRVYTESELLDYIGLGRLPLPLEQLINIYLI